jgi:hypothetical protein
MGIWYILWEFGILYGRLRYFMANWCMYFMPIWYILWPIGIFYICSFGIHILWPFDISKSHMIYFMAILYILWHFLPSIVIFFPFWYVATRKIWRSCSPLFEVTR